MFLIPLVAPPDHCDLSFPREAKESWRDRRPKIDLEYAGEKDLIPSPSKVDFSAKKRASH
jgi:hypothetical protein